MPKTVQIRDVPAEVHATLRARATASGKSMSDYLRSELIALANTPTNDEIYERVQARHGDEPSTETIVAIIREMRGPIPPES